MYSELEIDKLIKAVIKALYEKYGAKALLLIDEQLTQESFEQVVNTLKVPWLMVDILSLHNIPKVTLSDLDTSGVMLSAVHDLSNLSDEMQEQRLEEIAQLSLEENNYLCLVLGNLSVSKSEEYADFRFKTPKDRLVYQFLKYGKTVYYLSDDLKTTFKSKTKFIEKQSLRVEALDDLGFKMINQSIHIIDGYCDLKSLKAHTGETIMLTERAVLSPLAKDYLKSGAVKVLRK